MEFLQRQDPLIYQRVLDMPEFAFPNKFVARKSKLSNKGMQQVMARQI